jgi:hypothetical protein
VGLVFVIAAAHLTQRATNNQNAEDMDEYICWLRRSYYKFVEDLSKQCKQTVRHHLDSIDGGAKKKHTNMPAYANTDSNHHSNAIPGADDLGSKSGSSYSSICSISAQYFAKMREDLIERNVPSELNSGFLTPWYIQARYSK